MKMMAQKRDLKDFHVFEDFNAPVDMVSSLFAQGSTPEGNPIFRIIVKMGLKRFFERVCNWVCMHC